MISDVLHQGDGIEVLVLEMLEEKDKAGGVLIRQRANKERVNERKDSGRSANAERERQDPCQCEKRVLDQQSKCVANFLKHR